MRNKNINDYALTLKNQGYHNPIIKVLLLIFEILLSFETKKNEMLDNDPTRFLYTFGFNKDDCRQLLLPKTSTGYLQKYLSGGKSHHFLQLIGLKDLYVEMFSKYRIVLEILDCKISIGIDCLSVEKIINYTKLSQNAKNILKIMDKIYCSSTNLLYHQYFK